MELSTDRLRLRRWTAADRAPFAALNADPEVMEYFMRPLNRSESDQFVDRIEAQFERTGFGLWAVDDPDGFIGFVGLSVVPSELPCAPAVEIGWRLARHAWGRGYATEAAMAVVDHARLLRLGSLVSFTSAVNVRSLRVMERIGMTHDPEDDFDSPFVPEGHVLRPHLLYRIDLGTGGSASPLG